MKPSNSIIIHGDAFEVNYSIGGVNFPLIICDPPYGAITKEKWDKANYDEWMDHCVNAASQDATICMWGGVGKYKERSFLRFAATLEDYWPEWQIKNWITWSKKRAYGVKDNYLFTREELLIITRGKPTFNIPLLDQQRGYAGYNPKYPAKSPLLRRTNVWTDITELFSGKIHPTEKPIELYKILIATHSNPTDMVYDPCAGSCVTARAAGTLNRKYCLIEKEEEYLIAAGVNYT